MLETGRQLLERAGLSARVELRRGEVDADDPCVGTAVRQSREQTPRAAPEIEQRSVLGQQAADRQGVELVDADLAPSAELVVLSDPLRLVHHRRLAADLTSAQPAGELLARDDQREQRQARELQDRHRWREPTRRAAQIMELRFKIDRARTVMWPRHSRVAAGE
ncbi:MAG: hypothetical protein ACRDK9_13105 [Solirubrobacterales bacterium]